MASAIKAGAEAEREALELECADLERRIAERDEELAWMAARAAELEAAQVAKSAMPPPPPVDPAAAAWAKEANDLSALAIYAKEPGAPEKGTRGFWRGQVDRLGAHLLPDGGPDDRLRAALRDPRGHAFVEALQQCLT